MTAGAIPRLVAHRGYAARFPENSLEGIAAALQAGAWYVEFDVQLTADGVPVLSHDADLSRSCRMPGSLLEMDYAAVSRLSAGEPGRFGDRFAAARIGTLTQAMALVAETDAAAAFVEVKVESLERFGVEAVTSTVLAELAPYPGRFTVISFERAAVERARASAGVPTGWVLPAYDGATRAAARSLAPEFLFCNHRKLPPGDAPLWNGPWRWALYEVSDPALALALAQRGATLIETFAIGDMLADPALAAAARPVARA